MVMVHVDARRAGVRVPASLRGDAQLRLNLSYRFATHDLSVSDDYVRCTLSFQGVPFYCELPLEAVFAITSHVTQEALVWPETLAAALEPAPEVFGAMTVVQAEPEEEQRREAAGEEPQRTKSKPPLRNHLRLVK
jgi:stringent starvation protein B